MVKPTTPLYPLLCRVQLLVGRTTSREALSTRSHPFPTQPAKPRTLSSGLCLDGTRVGSKQNMDAAPFVAVVEELRCGRLRRAEALVRCDDQGCVCLKVCDNPLTSPLPSFLLHRTGIPATAALVSRFLVASRHCHSLQQTRLGLVVTLIFPSTNETRKCFESIPLPASFLRV